MDPADGSHCLRAFRLPRTRGDGPKALSPASIAGLAPPHTRGWTPTGPEGLDLGEGSPAHAGMDRRQAADPPATQRLPRTRGDGPSWSCRARWRFGAPPHTRGWTLSDARRQRRRSGSPAHAGMDPSFSIYITRVERLPRTRGDGPCHQAAVASILEAPPHTRGWTIPSATASRIARGSPAHAGMDPITSGMATTQRRLPRTRGDGPYLKAGMPVGRGAPPHTRGWTLLEHALHGVEDGSPAHAGMDPRTASAVGSADRLPRTRGDGPWRLPQPARPCRAPPHTRGWTRYGIREHQRGRGLPRTRGDGPRRHA